MEAEVLKHKLEEMKARSLTGELSASDRVFIQEHFERITFREFTGTSCSRCYADAFIEMYTTFKKHGLRPMPNFKLKRGIVVKSASYAEVITNSNLTDEMAVKWLKDNPKRIDLFEVYPADWEALIADNKPQNSEKPKESESEIATAKKIVKKTKKESNKKAE